MSSINSKSDRDQVRQKSSARRVAIEQIQVVIRDYAIGASPAQCMLRIIRIISKAGL